MKRMFQLLIFVAMASLLSGCATYMTDRGADFQDCFVLNGGIGPGLSVTAKVTDLATIRAGWSDVDKVGILGRYSGSWNEYETGIPLVLGRREIYPDKNNYSDRNRIDKFYSEHNVFTFSGHATPNAIHDGIGFSMKPKPVSHVLDIEAGATIGYVSFQAGFSIVEFVDLLLGVCCIDILGDDTPPPPREPEKEGKNS